MPFPPMYGGLATTMWYFGRKNSACSKTRKTFLWVGSKYSFPDVSFALRTLRTFSTSIRSGRISSLSF